MAEADHRRQKMLEAASHARVLAASVSAAVAFRDMAELEEAVSALRTDPNVAGVGIYADDGSLLIEGASDGIVVPSTMLTSTPARYADNAATATAVIERDGEDLGLVFVKLLAGSGASRVMHYLAPLLLVAMAAVLATAVALHQRSLATAHRELLRRSESLAREVAERRKAQSALMHAQKMEAVGQLTGGVAHDFNNLLMVVSAGLRLIETREDESKRATILAAMRQAVDRGASLTRQLLAFSRRQRLSPEVISLSARLEALRPLLERSLREDIVLEFDFGDPSPLVKIDPNQFDIAILNLAVNARDAMPKGGRLTIRVGSNQSSDAVDIKVIDTGEGMTPEVAARAFDPFFTTKAVGEGTGLGLSQVYGFALQSGGGASLDSEPGKGTTITLTLPRTHESPTQAAPGVAGAPGSNKLLLVVEDDDNVATMVCEMIADLGYRTLRVATAKDALDQIDIGVAVDGVFTDIIMPGGMDGVELAQEIRRRRPALPILLTTGYGGHGEADAQGFRVLRKPYTREDLIAALSSFSRTPV